MKTLIYLSVLFLSVVIMNAQKIEPIEKLYKYKTTNINDNIYFKDVNNVLGKFVGIWKGTYGDKKYEFRIVKSINNYKTRKYDEIWIRYIVTYLNGEIIENTTLLPDSSPYVMKGRYYVNNGYQLTYTARGGNCAQRGVMTLFVDNTNLGKMDAVLSVGGDLIDGTECPTMINQFFPASPTVFSFIKQ